MLHKKRKKQLANAIPANLVTEMAEPRIARSAKIAQLKLDAMRTPEEPSVTVPGSVDKIIPSRSARQPEKAQIAVAGDESHRRIRIENELTDEHGDAVKLRKGIRVEVTVTARVSPPKLP
jgi:hypothetical protein